MFRLYLITGIIFIQLISAAQPYVDPLNIRYTHAFKGKNKPATPFQHLYLGSDLPVKLKNNALFVFSPFYESWNIDSADKKDFLPEVSSIAFPIIAQIPLQNKSLSLTLAAIPKFNSEGLKLNGNTFQMGGIATINYKYNETLKYKLGVYVNSDQFGLFVIPLGGVDWKINAHNYLFGLLPGRLTYEHKITDHFYTGVNFRALTFSYLLNNGSYLRIDDNQLSAYLDCYATKNVVISTEAGYGIMRKLRAGNGHNKNYTTDYNWGDGLFVKLCASYRIRL
ncbi:hypothetical protein FRZ67_14455 [Panacibacter ginsenosidivorans]|uniref:Uncharacterized protein n=1 Tax=Panacibacter ginsenosidivorans TaxID=1813871 RepID=A0A5B8VAF2_9BACT|nr:DUF6268 family outer membrane beta-barrel protein [Panacibacter ginsenosidivorans]QEC68447.1 hypothetical protein FRZ67_14455 [Panacibacter ginsenosidivorans]